MAARCIEQSAEANSDRIGQYGEKHASDHGLVHLCDRRIGCS